MKPAIFKSTILLAIIAISFASCKKEAVNELTINNFNSLKQNLHHLQRSTLQLHFLYGIIRSQNRK